MPPQNHNSDLEIESEKKTTTSQQKESKEKKIEPEESARKSVADASDDSTAANATLKEDTSVTVANKSEGTVEETSSSVRERLKRHRVEVAGRVWIPEMWGKEELLKDWIDCAAFDSSLVKNSIIMSARASLIGDGRRANSTRLRIENSC
ncbi:hypothetical protein BUALT_Bualt09G0093000 [Buddleja alternifolia]|uniref:Uncharacterized protein n=1 Tax=Buddleja alternifolia TaxID=168488 RepID=A0AAV6XC00_9LAMI|nr:hypothetical protein BUALT_Bualt09G0093000 [Buddleja alternifolia]